MMIFLIAVTFFSHLILPIWLLYWLAFNKGDNLAYRICVAIFVSGYIVVMWIAGAAWYWFGGYWPVLYLVLLAVALAKMSLNLTRSPGLPLLPKRKLKPLMKFVAVITLAFGFTYGLPDIFAARNLPKDQTPLALEFPLQSGSYSVVHGGNSEALNHHHRIGSQRFALDIVKLGPWGTRAQGIAPQNLERYYIFEENLYAPCSGEVLAVANDFKDQAPFQSDPENPAGNHIVLYCGEASVLLAHLKQGSITLQPGDSVEAGDLVGQVGNSGNTSEPHLHIQAVKGRIAGIGEHVQGSQALPITFNGKFLSRGSVVQN